MNWQITQHNQSKTAPCNVRLRSPMCPHYTCPENPMLEWRGILLGNWSLRMGEREPDRTRPEEENWTGWIQKLSGRSRWKRNRTYNWDIEKPRARENWDNSEYRDNGIHREVRERREKNSKQRDIVPRTRAREDRDPRGDVRDARNTRLYTTSPSNPYQVPSFFAFHLFSSFCWFIHPIGWR